MKEPADCLEAWSVQLEAAAARTHGLFSRVTVLDETGSTQDAARTMRATAGDIVVAARQTAGRGRLGRAWADTANDGVAVTFAVEPASPERLSIASAVGVAGAVAAHLERDVGIKWPNDIVADGRKLAGILIEQARGLALIGVGVNVLQKAWPEELRPRAASLRQLGAAVDRLTVLEGLVGSMADALRLDDPALVAAFAKRDVLSRTIVTLQAGGPPITGRVIRVEPMTGLLMECDGRETWFPAATTTIVPTPTDAKNRDQA